MASSKTPTYSRPRRLLLQGCAATVAALIAPGLQASDFPEITWESLLPPDWNPMESFNDLQDLGALPDTDPKVQALYERMRKVWDEAPTIPTLAGKQVKIPGYVVPLENSDKGLKEFLLVPYHGACIHTPPPPANQIIHVLSNPPVRGFQTMSTVWVSGTLGVARSNSDMGVSGYKITAARVEQYRAQ